MLWASGPRGSTLAYPLSCRSGWFQTWVRMDQGPEPTHDPYPPIHTLIHTLWYCMIHTLDPYPWSIPLSHWRKIDAGPNAVFYPNTASGPRTATPVATPIATTVTTVATIAASAASVLLLLLLPLLVIFLPGAAAAAVASAAAPAGPALAATSWVATSNIASAPWRLVRPVLVPLGASCTSSGAMITSPSVSALSGTCRTRLDLKYPALFLHSHSVKAGPESVSRSIPVPYPNPVTPQQMPIWKSDSITTSTAASTTTTTPPAAAAIPTPTPTTPSTTAAATAATMRAGMV